MRRAFDCWEPFYTTALSQFQKSFTGCFDLRYCKFNTIEFYHCPWFAVTVAICAGEHCDRLLEVPREPLERERSLLIWTLRRCEVIMWGLDSLQSKDDPTHLTP